MAKKISFNRLNFSYFFSVSFLCLLAVFVFSASQTFYQQPQQLVMERVKCDVPLAPKNPKAVAGINPGEVLLTWEKVNNADHYSVMYGPKSLDYQWGADNVGNVDHYTVAGLNPGSAYFFIINAVNDCGSSPSVKEVAAYAAKRQPIIKEKGYQPPQASKSSYLTDLEPEPEKATKPAKKIVLEFSPKPSPAQQLEKKSSSLTGLAKALDFLNVFKWLILAVLILVFLTWYGAKLVREEKDTRYKKPKSEPNKPEQNFKPPEQNKIEQNKVLVDNKKPIDSENKDPLPPLENLP